MHSLPGFPGACSQLVAEGYELATPSRGGGLAYVCCSSVYLPSQYD